VKPYLTLGVAPTATDAVIRQTYLDAIKVSSPDHDPVRFQALTAAYTSIKDQAARDKHALFDITPTADSPLEAAILWAQAAHSIRPLPFESLKTFLRSCAKK
jgi:curved DNA-binding protein CbpA